MDNFPDPIPGWEGLGAAVEYAAESGLYFRVLTADPSYSPMGHVVTVCRSPMDWHVGTSVGWDVGIAAWEVLRYALTTCYSCEQPLDWPHKATCHIYLTAGVGD